MFKTDEINPENLGLDKFLFDVDFLFIMMLLEEDKEIGDETISWIINRPPIFAAIADDEMNERINKATENYIKKKPESMKIVRLIKNEIYDFLCTNSKNYNKERSIMSENINVLIKSLAVVIATKFGGIEIGIITSIIVAFFYVISKMGKNIACEYLKAQ